MKSAYEERLNELGQRFKVMCFNISSDDIINTMRSDPTTVEFIKDRMAEIVTEQMQDEKEKTIGLLYEEIGNYKAEVRTLKNQCDDFQAKFLKQDEETHKIRLSSESTLKNISAEYKNLEYEFNSYRQQAESKINKLTDESRFKDGEVYSKLEDNSRLSKKLEDLNRTVKLREQDLLSKDKDKQDTLHRYKLAQDKNQTLENNISILKEEIDSLAGRLNESKKVNESIQDKYNYLDSEKQRTSSELSEMRSYCKEVERERDAMKEKISDAAYKFEQTFTKQEDAYETQFLDLKDKNKRMKAKLIEERQKFEDERNKTKREIALIKSGSADNKETLENKINHFKQELESARVDSDNRVKQLLSDHSVKLNDLHTQHSYELANLKKQHDTLLDSKLADLKRDHTKTQSEFELREIELKNKLENLQNMVKTEYILKDRHDHLIQKNKDDLEDKYRSEIEQLKHDKEDSINKLNLDMSDRMTREVENLNNKINDMKIEMESKKFTHKEQINEYNKMLEEEVAKRKKINEELSQRNDSIEKLNIDLDSTRNKLNKSTEELKYLNNECSRLGSELSELQGTLKDLGMNYKQLNEKNETLVNELHQAKMAHTKLNEDLGDTKFRLKESTNKNEDLKMALKDQTDKGNNLYELLEVEKNKNYEKTLGSQKEFMAFRDECNEKVEKEAKSHRETLSRLHSKDLECKSYESKLESANEKIGNFKALQVTKERELENLSNNLNKLEQELKNQSLSAASKESELKEKLRQVKIKAVKAIHICMKRVNEFKYQVNGLKKNCNYDKIKAEYHNTCGLIVNRSQTVIKDIKYNYLNSLRLLNDRAEIEGKNRVNDKTKYFESLLNNHMGDYEHKLKEKAEEFDDLKAVHLKLQSEAGILKDDLELRDIQISQMKQRENEFLSEIKTLNEKLTLLKEVNNSSQNSHESSVSNLKTEYFNKMKEKESQLKNEFLSNLNTINESVVGKHKDLVSSYNLLVEYITELQNDLEVISKESNKQSEYLQSHHNDYVRYTKEVFMKLKQENEEIKQYLNEVELKYKKELQRLESKFMEISEKSEYELENFNRFKIDKMNEIETLSKQHRDIRKEVHTKDLVLEDLTREKEDARMKVKEFEERIEMELAKREGVIRAKDREIHELHALLEKSYISGIDGVRKSKNLDLQTQELQSMLHKIDKNNMNISTTSHSTYNKRK